jgi:hypothetical protein
MGYQLLLIVAAALYLVAVLVERTRASRGTVSVSS